MNQASALSRSYLFDSTLEMRGSGFLLSFEEEL